MKRVLAAFLACVALAQQPANDTVKFEASTLLVVEMVTVKDKSGKIIEGLTAKDFTITEDGKPQTIQFCEFQKLQDEALPPAPVKAQSPPAAPATAGIQPVTRTQITPEKPGDIRYRDRRLIGLYFDMTAMPPIDQLRALTAARKFIGTQMAGPDLMAIMSFSGAGVQVLQDFTADRDQLNTVIDTLILGEGQDDAEEDDESAADTGAAFGQNAGEFNIFNTDRQLAALQTAVKMLGTLNEKKSLVYFASGMRLRGIDNQAQLQATVNASIRANVSLFTVDARGLVAQPPLGDATQGSPGGLGMYTGAAVLAATNNFQRSQDTMWGLAADTGGKALLDNNELAHGIVQAQQAISSYYIIGYYSTNQALDGKFRRIKVTLNGGISGELSYRQGYYSGKEFSKFTSVDKERQLEDALMLGDPVTDLTIVMEVNYFQLNRAEYFVPVAAKIPGSELALARRGGAEHTLIDFIGEIKDEYGTTVTNMRDKVDIKLTGTTATELVKRPIQYDTGFTLLPGNYSLKFLARDAETGRIGTYLTRFVIPNLNKEEKRIPISSVVLSSQRVDLKDALYSAKVTQAAVNPLIQENQKLVPSVTRVFSKSGDLYVYLQAYERGAVTTQPLAAFVTFYRGQTKAFETPPLAVTEGLDPKSKAVPIRFHIPLGKLPLGKYDCQVTIVDPTGNKAAFWQAPIKLVK
jgi:VWFA-related protein